MRLRAQRKRVPQTMGAPLSLSSVDQYLDPWTSDIGHWIFALRQGAISNKECPMSRDGWCRRSRLRAKRKRLPQHWALRCRFRLSNISLIPGHRLLVIGYSLFANIQCPTRNVQCPRTGGAAQEVQRTIHAPCHRRIPRPRRGRGEERGPLRGIGVRDFSFDSRSSHDDGTHAPSRAAVRMRNRHMPNPEGCWPR